MFTFTLDHSFARTPAVQSPFGSLNLETHRQQGVYPTFGEGLTLSAEQIAFTKLVVRTTLHIALGAQKMTHSIGRQAVRQNSRAGVVKV